MRYALDTNAVVAALNGLEPLLGRLQAVDAGDLLLPAPVLAELIFGAQSSARVAENISRLDRLAASFAVVPFGPGAARRFGEIKAILRKRGLSKQDFDLAIASIALETDAVLVTHDAALIDGTVPRLRVEDWIGTPH